MESKRLWQYDFVPPYAYERIAALIRANEIEFPVELNDVARAFSLLAGHGSDICYVHDGDEVLAMAFAIHHQQFCETLLIVTQVLLLPQYGDDKKVHELLLQKIEEYAASIPGCSRIEIMASPLHLPDEYEDWNSTFWGKALR